MDVEGVESLVLMGGIETIQKFKPIIFFECTSKFINNELKQSLEIDFEPLSSVDILKNEGYIIIDLDSNNKLAIYE